MMGKDTIRWPNATQQGYLLAEEGDGLVMERTHVARGTVQKQTSPTLTTGKGGGSGVVIAVNSELRIRYLTPRECLRLMGQDEESSIVYGMPRVGWEMGGVQKQVPLMKMADEISALAREHLTA